MNDRENRRTYLQAEDRVSVEELDRVIILVHRSDVPNTVLRGRFQGDGFQQCGGGRRVVRKKIGGQ